MQRNIVSSLQLEKIKIIKLLEPLFFGYMFYSYLAYSLQIYIPWITVAWLLLLALGSFWAGNWTKRGKILIVLMCATTGAHLLIQILVHDVPVTAPYNFPFLFWPVTGIVVYVLASRAGFMKRLAFIMFGIGLVLHFFAVSSVEGVYSRLFLNANSGIDNANDYGIWLAFCSLIFWLWGWKEIRRASRLFFWACALLAVIMSMQTVSRTALLSLGVACIIGMRGIPRKYWFGAFLGLGMIFLMLNYLPFFNTEIQYYQDRLNEDTGRTIIWSASIPLIEAHPWLGYGTDVLGGHNAVNVKGKILPLNSPHDPFILLWLGSGIIPVITFSLLWLMALIQSIRFRPNSPLDYDAFPLVVFGITAMLFLNLAFAEVWCVAILAYSYVLLGSSVAKARGLSYQKKQKMDPNFHSITGKSL